MTILIKRKSDPGRLYVFEKVKKVHKSTDDIPVYTLENQKGEIFDIHFEVSKFDVYKKMEFQKEN